MAANKLFTQARTSVLLDQVFFGSLALRLQPVEDPTCQTAWTDGVHLGFNSEWFAKLSHEARVGVICHEVMHCSNGTIWRKDAREHGRWNAASDYSLNPIIKDAGMHLPEGVLLDPAFKGLSAEAIYSKLPQNPPGGGSWMDGMASWGEVRDSPDPSQAKQQEQEWAQATLQAAMAAKQQGKLPAGLERLIATITEPACRDLISALQEFVSRSARDDFSWRTPNRRFTHMGLYLPSLFSEALPPVICAVDSSGSISPDELSLFVGACQRVLEDCKPESMTIYSCDAKIHATYEVMPGDLIPSDQKAFPGGGGSSSVPVFKRIEKEGSDACCLIYLTDSYLYYPDKIPELPTLWVIRDSMGYRNKPPFGSCIYLDS